MKAYAHAQESYAELGLNTDRAIRQAPQEGPVVVEDMPEVHPHR